MRHPFFYGGRVRRDGHGFPRNDFHAIHLEFFFPDRNVWCTTVNEDNKGSIHLANNLMTTSNSKHIFVRHHFLRGRGQFKVIHVSLAHHMLTFSPRLCARRRFVFTTTLL